MRTRERAFGLAEKGIAYAEGRLYAAPVSGLTDPSTLPVPASRSTRVKDGRTRGSYDAPHEDLDAHQGRVHATASTRTGCRTGADRHADEHGDVHDDTAVYNYMFANSRPNASTSGNGAVTVPLLARLRGPSGHTQFKGNDLEVGSYLTLGPNAGVGTSRRRSGR